MSGSNSASIIVIELEAVETALEAPPSVISAPPSASVGGRAHFDSVTSALMSVRRRLRSLRQSRQGNNQTVAPAEESKEGENRETVVRDLTERLQDAERAHEQRIPLELARSHRSSMALGGGSESSLASSMTSFSEKETGDASNDRSKRHASVLVASRRLANATEGLIDPDDTVETDIHKFGVSQVLPSIRELPLSKEPSGEDLEALDKEDPVDELPPIDNANSIVYSWGTGSTGSLLHGDTQDHHTTDPDHSRLPPTSRIGRPKAPAILSISFGPHHAAAVTASGEVLTCGTNANGEVDPTRPRSKDKKEEIISRPTHLECLSMTRILQISCGLDHTAAVTSTRTVLTWGSNDEGQLGHFRRSSDEPSSTSFQRPKAMVLGPGRRASTVSCGDKFTLVLTTKMSLVACGVKDITGQRGPDDGPGLPSNIPTLEGLPVTHIAAGKRHAVALTAHGTAYAWGYNKSGCCGRPSDGVVSVPHQIKVSTSKKRRKYSDGEESPNPFPNWALWDDDDDDDDDYDNYGFRNKNTLSLASDVAFTHAACGDKHTVLVTKSGRLFVFGSNESGQLGLQKGQDDEQPPCHVPIPVNIPGVQKKRKFVEAQAGSDFTIVLDDMGDVWHMGGEGLQRILNGKFIKFIAAGGQSRAAVAQGLKGSVAFKRQFSIQGSQPLFFAGLEEGNGWLNSLLLSVTEDEAKVKAKIKAEKGEDNNKDSDEKEPDYANHPLSEAGRKLASHAEEMLQYPAVLNGYYLEPSELDEVYRKFLTVEGPVTRAAVVDSMVSGMRHGLQSLHSNDARMMFPESVRCLLMYLQCPLFGESDDELITKHFDPRGDLSLLLCESILSLLPFEGYRAFQAWSTSLYRRSGLFVKVLVRHLLAQLKRGILEDGGIKRAVPVIVAVLRWLHNASERVEGIAKAEDFYCDAISHINPESLYDDLRHFKAANRSKRATNFFLCAHPFLFSPGTKRNLLQIENQVAMIRAATSTGVHYDAEQRTYTFEPFFILAIDREHMLKQTLQKVEAATPGELRKQLKVVFKGEEGVDAGGVTKEFFQLLAVQLFDINTGMWSTKVGGDDPVTWFNSDCTWNEDGYHLVGILFGLALYNGVLLDVHFPSAVYRKLIGLPLGLEDMVDKEVQSGLQSLLDYEGDDVEDVFCMDFEVTWMDMGNERRLELKPGGAGIPVTSDNKEEYVMLYVKWLLVDSIRAQYDAFERGFMRVMEASSLDLLKPEELELLVVGTPELDFSALMSSTTYEGYTEETEVVQNFWRFVKDADTETQIKLLKFSTGSTRAPIGGLGEMPFKIQRAGPDSMQLPTSHTCFNTLLLPEYDSYDKLVDRLSRAIIECEGFGLQ